MKMRQHTLAQLAGFADVQDGIVLTMEDIYAGAIGDIVEHVRINVLG